MKTKNFSFLAFSLFVFVLSGCCGEGSLLGDITPNNDSNGLEILGAVLYGDQSNNNSTINSDSGDCFYINLLNCENPWDASSKVAYNWDNSGVTCSDYAPFVTYTDDYFTYLTSCNSVRQIEVKTGTLVWNYELSTPYRMTSLVGNEEVIIVTNRDEVKVLNSQSGELIWTYAATENTRFQERGISLIGNYLYIKEYSGMYDASPVRRLLQVNLKRYKVKTIQDVADEDVFFTSPVIDKNQANHSKTFFVQTKLDHTLGRNVSHLYEIHPSTGTTTILHYDFVPAGAGFSRIEILNGQLVGFIGYGDLVTFDLRTGDLVTRIETDFLNNSVSTRSGYSVQIQGKDYIVLSSYMFNGDDYSFWLVDPSTGEFVVTKELNGKGLSSLIEYDDNRLYGSGSDHFYTFKPNFSLSENLNLVSNDENRDCHQVFPEQLDFIFPFPAHNMVIGVGNGKVVGLEVF